MSESLRPEPRRAPESAGADRDAKTEDLLLGGLDHYFAGAYEQAIHVWTRVLFLDRGHARARAYIERARSALAEQQRESEELLQQGVAAFDRGEIALARRLLTSSVERGGPQDVALPILARLNRLDGAVSAADRVDRRQVVRDTRGQDGAPAPQRTSRAWLLVALSLAGVAAVVFLGAAGGVFDPSPEDAAPAAPLASPASEPLPLARPGVIALGRAARLFETGHPADALRLLQQIRPGDAARAEADRLRARIQRRLLQPPSAASGTAASQAPAANPTAGEPGAR